MDVSRVVRTFHHEPESLQVDVIWPCRLCRTFWLDVLVVLSSSSGSFRFSAELFLFSLASFLLRGGVVLVCVCSTLFDDVIIVFECGIEFSLSFVLLFQLLCLTLSEFFCLCLRPCVSFFRWLSKGKQNIIVRLLQRKKKS